MSFISVQIRLVVLLVFITFIVAVRVAAHNLLRCDLYLTIELQ